ncbi:MAG: hypothetical protein ACSHX9_06585 [Luteolibacter sp.]
MSGTKPEQSRVRDRHFNLRNSSGIFLSPDYHINVILRKFIAVIMALVIANPACCCTFTSHLAGSQQTSQSCCSGKKDPSQNQNDTPCTCSFAKEKAAPEADLFSPQPGSTILPPLANTSPDFSLPTLPEAVVFLKKWPPGDIPVPTHGSRLAAKCSYLI